MTDNKRIMQGFFSYSRQNDLHDGGKLSLLRKSLEVELWAQTAEEIKIFQDQDDIFWGQKWKERITQALNISKFFIAIITPSYLASEFCRFEFEHYLKQEKKLGGDRILPLLYIETPGLKNDHDSLAVEISKRQWIDWTEIRFASLTSVKVRKMLAMLAKRIQNLISQEMVINVHKESISIPNSVITKTLAEQNWQPSFDNKREEHLLPILPAMYIPISDGDKTKKPLQITILLHSQKGAELDRLRIKTLYGTLISFHGRDRFTFQIFENGKGHLIDFPVDTTRICPELLARLKKVLGNEDWRIEPIEYQ